MDSSKLNPIESEHSPAPGYNIHLWTVCQSEMSLSSKSSERSDVDFTNYQYNDTSVDIDRQARFMGTNTNR